MYDSLLREVKEQLAPNEIWTLRRSIEEVLNSEMASLPQGKEISKLERRFPTTLSALQAFLNAFLHGTFFKFRILYLQPDVFERFLNIIRKGALHIADVGSGPAVASLAFLDLITAINQSMKTYPD